MAEESLRIANDAVAHALQAVVKEQSEVDKWNAKIDNEENVNGPRMTIYVERVEEAYERLKDANERLDKAREYFLQVSQQNQQNAKEMLVKELTYGKVNILLG
jgi:chromatin remodeling complex protein RSC6